MIKEGDYIIDMGTPEGWGKGDVGVVTLIEKTNTPEHTWVYALWLNGECKGFVRHIIKEIYPSRIKVISQEEALVHII